MEKYRIPHTDLEVTSIGYGCGSFGGAWDNKPVTTEEFALASRVMRAAFDAGMNYFDVAESYAYGKAETAVGHVLKDMPSLRSQIVLQTKCGIVLPSGMELENPPLDDPYYLDSSKEHIVSSVEGSLRRMGTDYIDILLIHRPDVLMEPDEVAAAFDHLHSSGKVRHFGLSNFSPAQTEHLRRSLSRPLVTNQLRFGLGHPYLVADGFDFNRVGGKRAASQYAGTDGALEYFQANDILIQAWSPLQGTFRGGRWNEYPDRLESTVTALEAVAEKYATSPDAIAIAWVMRHPSKMVPIVGTHKPDRLRAYADAAGITLDRKDWYRLFYAACGQTAFAVHQG